MHIPALQRLTTRTSFANGTMLLGVLRIRCLSVCSSPLVLVRTSPQSAEMLLVSPHLATARDAYRVLSASADIQAARILYLNVLLCVVQACDHGKIV